MYKLTSSTSIVRADGACIPADPANNDYAAYLVWVGEGNTPGPADVPPPPSPLEQIRALEAQYADAQAKLTRQSLLILALDRACADTLAENLTRDQVHALLLAGDNGYSALWNLEQQINALRAQV